VLAPLSHWRPDEAASDGAMQRAIRRVVHPAGLSYRRVGCRSTSATANPLPAMRIFRTRLMLAHPYSLPSPALFEGKGVTEYGVIAWAAYAANHSRLPNPELAKDARSVT
jgi:hypothetical protein